MTLRKPGVRSEEIQACSFLKAWSQLYNLKITWQQLILFRWWYYCESKTSGSFVKDNGVTASNATENTDVYL